MLSYHCSFLLKYLKFPGFWCIQLLDIFCVLDYANQLLDIFCVLVYANVFSSPSLFFLWNNRETLYTSYKSFFCEVFSYLFISFPSGIPLNLYGFCTLGSVQFSLSVMSDSLRPYEPQHARLPCPSPTPRVHPNPCPLSWWFHPTISSSVFPFSCPQYFPASGYFQMSQLFVSGGQSIGVSTLASFLPMNTQGWSPLKWTG